MSESSNHPTNHDSLSDVDDAKRATLMRLIKGSAFVAPVVASFAMDGLTISQAHATCANATCSALKESDRRLKTGIARVVTLPSGLGLYRFRYLWSDTEQVGVMAQEVRETLPEAVVEGADGFLRVDYGLLGLEMLTYAEWCRREGRAMAA